MRDDTKQPKIECRPFWFERRSDGAKMFCFSVKRRGKKVITKLTFDELKEAFKHA